MSIKGTYRVDRKILKTTTLYHDGKTQVPKTIIKLLNLEAGSQIVWVYYEKDGKICVESAMQ